MLRGYRQPLTALPKLGAVPSHQPNNKNLAAAAASTCCLPGRSSSRPIRHRGGPGEPGARTHDLRHTCAVGSLEGCGPDRHASARHLIALSTCLGHARVADTYWYLEATPIARRRSGWL